MISEVDDALRTLVRDGAVGTDVEVVFDAPTKEWSARRNAPTVNLYLYDIREDLRRREVGWVEVLDADGTMVSRRPKPRYFKLSYLVTAWTQRPEDEHRLLASLLMCFVKQDAMPRPLVTGPLEESGKAIPITVALPPPEDRAFADVWTALGGELKPSLDIVVTAPVFVGEAEEAGPPVTEGPRISVFDTVNGGVDEHRHKHAVAANGGEGESAEGFGLTIGKGSTMRRQRRSSKAQE